MNKIWQDAVEILETASAQRDAFQEDFAILVDDRQGIRMVAAAGWRLDALRHEYQAGTAFLVRRTSGAVTVQAKSGTERCSLRRNTGATTLAHLTGGIAHHLVRREPLALTAGVSIG